MRFPLLFVAFLVGCAKPSETNTLVEPIETVSIDAAGPASEVIQNIPVDTSANVVTSDSLNDFSNINIEDGADYEVFSRTNDGKRPESLMLEFDPSSHNSGKLRSWIGSNSQRYNQTFD